MKYKENKLSLGRQPVSNRFLYQKNDSAPQFPMEFYWNTKFGCMMIVSPFPADEIQPQFSWITCFEPEEHLDDLVENMIKVCGLTKASQITGYSFKDDTTLKRLAARGHENVRRIDPKADLNVKNPLASIETLQNAFNSTNVELMIKRNKQCDVVIARHVIEHAYCLDEYLSCLGRMITDDGYLVIEIPDCERAMLAGDCTILWEEHITYFNGRSFKAFLNHANYSVVFEKSYFYPLENSMVFIAQKNQKQENLPLANPDKDKEFFSAFCDAIGERALKIREILENLRTRRGNIGIFGAGHLTVAFLQYNNISDLVSVCFDDNDNKIGMFLPVGGIPIIGSEMLNVEDYPICLLGLNPQHHKKIREVFSAYLKNGGRLISIFPETDDCIDEVK